NDEGRRIARPHGLALRRFTIFLLARFLGVERPRCLFAHNRVLLSNVCSIQDARSEAGKPEREKRQWLTQRQISCVSAFAPKPSMRSAHCQPTVAPLRRGRNQSESTSVSSGQIATCTQIGGM